MPGTESPVLGPGSAWLLEPPTPARLQRLRTSFLFLGAPPAAGQLTDQPSRTTQRRSPATLEGHGCLAPRASPVRSCRTILRSRFGSARPRKHPVSKRAKSLVVFDTRLAEMEHVVPQIAHLFQLCPTPLTGASEHRLKQRPLPSSSGHLYL